MLEKLQIEVKGELQIIGEYKETLKEIKSYYEKLEIKKIKNQNEYKESFRIKKEIEDTQQKIKELIRSIDNEVVLDFKERLLEINKILAGLNTKGKKEMEAYKLNEKDLIIENGYSNIKSQPKFEADYEVYKNECLLQFKGKSKFEEMQDIALKIADDYSNKLEMQQLKFEKNFNEIKLFSNEIQLVEPDFVLEKDIIDLVNFGKDIENLKDTYKSKRNFQIEKEKLEIERQQKAKLEAEKLEIEKDIVKEIKEPVISKEEIKIEKKYTFTITIQTTIAKKELLKEFLLKNEIRVIQ